MLGDNLGKKREFSAIPASRVRGDVGKSKAAALVALAPKKVHRIDMRDVISILNGADPRNQREMLMVLFDHVGLFEEYFYNKDMCSSKQLVPNEIYHIRFDENREEEVPVIFTGGYILSYRSNNRRLRLVCLDEDKENVIGTIQVEDRPGYEDEWVFTLRFKNTSDQYQFHNFERILAEQENQNQLNQPEQSIELEVFRKKRTIITEDLSGLHALGFLSVKPEYIAQAAKRKRIEAESAANKRRCIEAEPVFVAPSLGSVI